MDYLIVVISSLLSGTLGVIISAYYYGKKEKKSIQVKLITDMFANRHQLTSDEFNRVLNSIPIVFCESKAIVQEYHDFHDLVSNKKNSNDINRGLFNLLNKLIIHTKLSKDGFNDITITKVFGFKNDR